MDEARRLVMRCLPPRAATRAGTLSAALLRLVASRLPVRDAARVTALSPRWRRAWRSMPLVLDDVHLLVAGYLDSTPSPAVDYLLAAHPGPFRAVRLTYSFFGTLGLGDADDEESDDTELARWPRLLAAGDVQDLVFVSPPPPMDMPLHADILRCTELRRLYLGFWNFPDTRDLPIGAGVFPHLREFALLHTCIKDRDLDHMLASSPALQKLALVCSYCEPEHVRLRGRNLRCVLFCLSTAVELAVADAPRLERLIMWGSYAAGGFDDYDDDSPKTMRVRIDCAPELKVLGYLDTSAHQLQIGEAVIMADSTEASPSFMVPSVKILALKVDFCVFTEVQMLSSFLRCFPNVETLHVEFAMAADQPTGEHYGEFLEKICPIECLRSHVSKVVLHEFHGDICEVVFLQYLTQRAKQLQDLTIILSNETLLSVGDMKSVLKALATPPWASESCTVSLAEPPKSTWNFHRASDLSVGDPFALEHGRELFTFTKEEEQAV